MPETKETPPQCGGCQHYNSETESCMSPFPMWVLNHMQGNEYINDLAHVAKDCFADTCDLYRALPKEEPFSPPPKNDFAHGERKVISEAISDLEQQLTSPMAGPHPALCAVLTALECIKYWIDKHDEHEVKATDALMNKLEAQVKQHKNGCECIQCSPIICGCGTEMDCTCPDCEPD